mgnify:CR=1 FL=1
MTFLSYLGLPGLSKSKSSWKLRNFCYIRASGDVLWTKNSHFCFFSWFFDHFFRNFSDPLARPQHFQAFPGLKKSSLMVLNNFSKNRTFFWFFFEFCFFSWNQNIPFVENLNFFARDTFFTSEKSSIRTTNLGLHLRMANRKYRNLGEIIHSKYSPNFKVD